MSNNFTDLPGLGRVVAELRKLLMGALRFPSEKRALGLKNAEQALKNEQWALKNQELSIKNKCALLQLAEKFLAASKKHEYALNESLELIALLGSLDRGSPVPRLELPPSEVDQPKTSNGSKLDR